MAEGGVQVPVVTPRRLETFAGPIHTIILLLVMIGVSVAGYFSAQRMRSAQNPNRLFFYGVTMAWEWIMVAYIYWGVRRHGKSMRELVGGGWTRARDFFRDLGIALSFWIAALFVLGIVAHVVGTSGMNQAARTISPQGLQESVLWIAVAVTAGFCEETIFRGYLQKQLAAWTQSAPAGVMLSAVLFGTGHIYQGGKATVVIGVYGLMFGILAEVRRSLRPGMMTHAWHDALAGLLLRFIPKSPSLF